MALIVDLHIHSHYSRATSKDCTLEGLYKWGKLKGINVIGTGDFTHPSWFLEIQNKLYPTEGGLYKLRDDIAHTIDKALPASVRKNILRFVPTVEIATVYAKGGQTRKLHQLIVMPTLEAAAALNSRLEHIGNLRADGRPIIGMDSKELLRLSLEVEPRSLFVPAHIWTPWFGLFGSKSGFDSLAEAYEELAPEIRAIETGLSSDPAMNLRVGDLDGITLSSNSDAHSPQKLGREASIVEANSTYDGVIGAYKTNDARFVGTIEFFPQEGKYFADGHRSCNIRFTSEQTKAHDGICPVCHKPLVMGVNYRVDELAALHDANAYKNKSSKQTDYIIPLPEIVAELCGVKTVSSKTVTTMCTNIYKVLGSEFDVLRIVPTERIHDAGFASLAIAIERLRKHNVVLNPGFDGVYGSVKLFHEGELAQKQTSIPLA